MSDTTELDKQSAIIATGDPAIVQGFLDWMLDEKGWVLTEPRSHDYAPIMKRPEEIMADYFGIDLDKIEAERRTLLSKIQNTNLSRS